MSKWKNVNINRPCPICNKTDWCSYTIDGLHVCCKRVLRHDGEVRFDKVGSEFYYYNLSGGNDYSRPPLPSKPATKRADAKTLDRVYQYLFSKLKLNADHRQDLLDRGLTIEQINQHGFASWAGPERKSIAENVVNEFGESIALKVPGFFWNKEKDQWSIAGKSGIAIPCYNLDGLLVAIRLRKDGPLKKDEAKYVWVSSSYHDGPGPEVQPHFPAITRELLKTKPDEIRITEGEIKATIAAIKTGIPSLSIPGVGNWKTLLPVLEQMTVKRVIIAYDMDCKTNSMVANHLSNLAGCLDAKNIDTVLEQWDPKFKGIDDALVAGASIDVVQGEAVFPKIENIVKAAKEANPAPYEINLYHTSEKYKNITGQVKNDTSICSQNGQSMPVGEIKNISNEHQTPDFATSLDDIGNAQRLIKLHGKDIRYCAHFRSWFVWDGRRWKIDDIGLVTQKAISTVSDIFKEASQVTNKNDQDKIVKHAQVSRSKQKIRAMIDLAKDLEGVHIQPYQFDQNPWLFNVANGTIDLKTGQLRQHSREDYITKISDISFQQDAKCPVFDAFLRRIMDGDKELIDFIGRCMAYALTGSTSERCMFILHGGGKNGKSKLVESIAMIMGEYACRMNTETLMAKRNEGIPNDIAMLRGIRFAYCSEGEENRRLAEAKVKDLTGDETITARFLHGEFFGFKPQFKIWFSTNHKPRIRGNDEAIWDRIRLLPFNVSIPKPQQDKELSEKFKAELPGILMFAVRHLDTFNKFGIDTAKAVHDATKCYRQEEDVVSQFLDEMCIFDKCAKVTIKALYEKYTEWCNMAGECVMGKNKFSDSVSHKGFERDRHGKARFFKGLRLVCENDYHHKSMLCDTREAVF